MFPHSWSQEGGHLLTGETPGHGADIDEKVAAKHPYEQAYLPVARAEDGTLWSW
jgi:mannonate dehydratase